MDKQIKPQPRVCVGALIFNEKEQLFLMRSPKWHDKYVCPGGGVKSGESLMDALKREVREETRMEIDEIEFLGVNDGVGLGKRYKEGHDHLIMIDYKAKTKGKVKVKLNKEGSEYKWRSIEEWLNEPDLQVDMKDFMVNIALKDSQSEYLLKYQRALADYQNLTKRSAQEKEEFAKYANEQLLHQIIPVYDNLKLSLEHSNEENPDAWLQGVKHVVNQFRTILEDIGVEEIDAIDKPFDHNTMEAIDGQGETVRKVVKPGYKLKGKLIIPAKVVVGE